MSEEYTESFNKFYDAYPRKSGKRPAFIKWRNISESLHAVIIGDIEKRSRMRFWSDNPRLIALPATYLNQERWQDDWMADMKSRPEGQADVTTPRSTYVHDPGEQRCKWGEIAQRICFRWLTASGGVPKEGIKAFVKIKNDTVNEMRQGLSEEPDAYDAGFLLADTVALRLDLHFGRSLRAGVLAGAKKKAKP